MQVYWENYDGKKRLPGRKQWISWHFEYGGSKRIIPYLYRFPQGIAFDLITLLNAEELRLFSSKYENSLEHLSSVQQRAIREEHPYQPVPFGEFTINGKPTPGSWSATENMYVPWQKKAQNHSLQTKAYAQFLRDASCFSLTRCYISTRPEEASLNRQLYYWLFPEKINTLQFKALEKTKFWAVEKKFSIPSNLAGCQTETFLHPKTNTLHRIHFQHIVPENIEIPLAETTKCFTWTLHYEIEPALPAGDQLCMNTSLEYQLPEPKEETAAFLPEATNAIAVIGGADGPTSLSLIGYDDGSSPLQTGLHHLPLHCCLSKPTINIENHLTVVLEGIYTKWLPEETFLWPPS